jgi:hypothetical protein
MEILPISANTAEHDSLLSERKTGFQKRPTHFTMNTVSLTQVDRPKTLLSDTQSNLTRITKTSFIKRIAIFFTSRKSTKQIKLPTSSNVSFHKFEPLTEGQSAVNLFPQSSIASELSSLNVKSKSDQVTIQSNDKPNGDVINFGNLSITSHDILTDNTIKNLDIANRQIGKTTRESVISKNPSYSSLASDSFSDVVDQTIECFPILQSTNNTLQSYSFYHAPNSVSETTEYTMHETKQFTNLNNKIDRLIDLMENLDSLIKSNLWQENGTVLSPKGRHNYASNQSKQINFSKPSSSKTFTRQKQAYGYRQIHVKPFRKTNRNNSGQDSFRQNNRFMQSAIGCANCGLANHNIEMCFQYSRKNKVREKPPFCYFCQQVGHKANSCQGRDSLIRSNVSTLY